MAIVVVGLDHHTAPVEVRERLDFRPSEIESALHTLRRAGLQEAAILSTCNRVEIFGGGDDAAAMAATIVDFLAGYHVLRREEFEPYLYCYQDAAAVRHLCATAAGIESLIIGEAQIQGQVRGAALQAQQAGTAGPLLNALFRTALVTGKRARTETAIGRSAVSVSHAGVELARRLLGDLRAVHVLLVGSGKMSELAARNLLDNGARAVSLVNRSLERAQALAAAWGGQALPFDQLPSTLIAADVVISSTAAPHAVISAEEVRRAMEARPERPLIMIDLAVPRDIDPDAAAIPGVYLYNIDDLEQVVMTNLERRAAELQAVEAIVEEEAAAFEAWLASRAVSPTLEDLRNRADAIRRAELQKALRRLGPISEREQRIIEAFSIGMVNKLLHEPTMRLRHQAAEGNGTEYAEALRYLFGLDSRDWNET
ncbi:MAG: glutamyl-tRNA reductase [Herpetosiphonaceae bacterium]|nr:MAG: glutamyl-tRNA reductase [Herpetosiphonaceae bacterium]